jgi:ubiquinone/menaquinone biosynthesis C-methylase UbiE
MSRASFDESYGVNPAENYERFFVPSIGEPLAKALVDRAEIRDSNRVLDVACGTGIVARVAAQSIKRPRLAGLDPNAAMLAVARAAAPATTAIEWHEASAEQMPLPDASFDVVLCQMGLQFMVDKPAAIREMWRVLADGGRLWVSVSGPATGVFAALEAGMERHIGPHAAAFVGKVFSLHDTGEIEGLLDDAGFRDISVDATIQQQELPPAREFLWQYIHSTPLAGVVSQASPEAQAALEREVMTAWREFEQDDVLRHELRLVVATGAKTAA